MKIERNQEIDMTWKYAFKQSLPIMAGYVVLGMGFGSCWKQRAMV